MQRYPAEAVIEHMIKEASEGNGSRIYRNPKDTFDEMEDIAKEAADSHLGVRYMRSRIKALMEDRIFEDDESEGYRISC